MTRIFDEEGRSFAVTKIAALPCEVTAIKDNDRDGYKAVKISAYKISGEKKKVVKEAEFAETNVKKYKVGEVITLKNFKKDEIVTIEGVAKGKGFAGTIKRHNFAMGPVSHGSKNVRKPGSIGGGYPERVVKGRKMAGRMGGDNVTVKNLKVADVDDQYILITGSIPGPNKSILKVYGIGEKAEEVVDYAAEEERIAQKKMLEADKEEKAESVAAGAIPDGKAEQEVAPKTEEVITEEKSE